MIKQYPYLQNHSDFLLKLDSLINQKQYVKITILDFNERPIQEIQGEIASGSLNLDGTSSVRRTCSFNTSVSSNEYDADDLNAKFSLNKKVYLETGIMNETDEFLEYPILWFPQGVFAINDFSISSAVSSAVNITLALKDKMSLLNGDLNGQLPATTIFDSEYTQNEQGTAVSKKVLIYDILIELVNHFGGEDLSRIFIENVPRRIKKIMKWNGSVPIYFIYDSGSLSFSFDKPSSIPEYVDNIGQLKYYKQYVNGQDIGYVYSDFVYSDDLIASVGDTITSVLDKIKEYLGNYEYYYDIYGNFHFREIKNYLNTSLGETLLEEMDKNDYLIEINSGKSVYSFNDSSNLISLSRNPKYSNIKNDFIIEGERKSTISSTSYPVRYHLAIESKPNIGNTYNVLLYTDTETNIKKAKVPLEFEDYSNFPSVGNFNVIYFDKGNNKYYLWDIENLKYAELTNYSIKEITTKDWRTELYLRGEEANNNATDSGFYYPELENAWPAIYDIENQKFFAEEELPEGNQLTTAELTTGNYFLDFIDTTASISKFSVSNIGRRTKVVSNQDVNCLFEPTIEDIIVLDTSDTNFEEYKKECVALGQTYIQCQHDIFQGFVTGGYYNAAFDQIKLLLYQYTTFQNTISIQCMPIFYLDANSRIHIDDKTTNTFGDFIIQSISLPLGSGQTMSISCSAALEKF